MSTKRYQRPSESREFVRVYVADRLNREASAKPRGYPSEIAKKTGFSRPHVSTVMHEGKGVGEDFGTALATQVWTEIGSWEKLKEVAEKAWRESAEETPSVESSRQRVESDLRWHLDEARYSDVVCRAFFAAHIVRPDLSFEALHGALESGVGPAHYKLAADIQALQNTLIMYASAATKPTASFGALADHQARAAEASEYHDDSESDEPKKSRLKRKR